MSQPDINQAPEGLAHVPEFVDLGARIAAVEAAMQEAVNSYAVAVQSIADRHRVHIATGHMSDMDPAAANGAARLLFVAKHIERIGDYVKDICELNVYLREAVFIKHGANI